MTCTLIRNSRVYTIYGRKIILQQNYLLEGADSLQSGSPGNHTIGGGFVGGGDLYEVLFGDVQ